MVSNKVYITKNFVTFFLAVNYRFISDNYNGYAGQPEAYPGIKGKIKIR